MFSFSQKGQKKVTFSSSYVFHCSKVVIATHRLWTHSLYESHFIESGLSSYFPENSRPSSSSSFFSPIFIFFPLPFQVDNVLLPLPLVALAVCRVTTSSLLPYVLRVSVSVITPCDKSKMFSIMFVVKSRWC